MPNGSHILHHTHKQKRAIEAAAKVEGLDKKEVKEAIKQPINRFKRVLDKLVYFTGAATIIFAVPQALQIWLSQTAAGVSLATWAAFFVNAIIWTSYGFIHQEKPIITLYFGYIIVDAFVVLGILLYR
jgi:uncharacterized protein with PQ loop repeat